MLYDKLTKYEINYMSQDGIFEQEINDSTDWEIIDYLTPLYGRFTDDWYNLVGRLISD